MKGNRLPMKDDRPAQASMSLQDEIRAISGDKDFFEVVTQKLKNGWQCALLSTATPGVVRLQLQSAPPESEDTGEIVCAHGKTVAEAVAHAIKISEREPVTRVGIYP